MTRPRSTTSQADELGAILASLKARVQSVELLAHTPCSGGGGGGCPCPQNVLIAGDTMTGFLTLNADPTAALHAATKQYADTKVPLAGGTMTGLLTLSADPIAPLHAATKQYVDGMTAPTGMVSPYAGVAAPSGWLLCDGTAYSIAAYPSLYTVIGASFNTSSGQAAPGAGLFRVPDLRSRMPIGAGTGIGLSARSLAQSGGSESKTIASGNLPTHTHTINHDHPSTTSGTQSANHTHTVTTGGVSANHVHAIGIRFAGYAAGGNGMFIADGGFPAQYNSANQNVDHTHSGTTSNNSVNHTHDVDIPNFTGNSGDGGFANTAMDVMNPFLGLNFIIKA